MKYKAISSLMRSKFAKCIRHLHIKVISIADNVLIDLIEETVKSTGNLFWYYFLARYFEEIDQDSFAHYLKKGAELGHVLSQTSYAEYLYGLGEESENEAMKWFEKAANSNDISAQICLAEMYDLRKDYKTMFEWYLKAAEQNSTDAMYMVGNCFQEGNGVNIDYEKALYWYKKAEEMGDTDALCSMSRMYYMGLGVEQDHEKSFQLSLKAAKSESSVSQYNLAMKYYYGHYVEKDLSSAFKWFLRSAEIGYASSQRMVACMYASGEGVEMDMQKSLDWLEKSYVQGEKLTSLMYGIMFYFGLGKLQVDYLESIELLGNTGTDFDEKFLKKVTSYCYCNHCLEEDFVGYNYECAKDSCGSDLCQKCYDDKQPCPICGGSEFTKVHSLQCFLPILKYLNQEKKSEKLENLIKLLEF